MKVTFWGVRGSIPAPLTSDQVAQKFLDFLAKYCPDQDYPLYSARDTITQMRGAGHVFAYGGNTSCVSVAHPNGMVVLDLGTGARSLGNALIGDILAANKRSRLTFCLSHVHWDHIQGIPYFAPLYLNKHDGFDIAWQFYGGTNWYRKLEASLKGQMNQRNFPVSWEKIEQLLGKLDFHDVHDGFTFDPFDGVRVVSHELDHPQETYGWRITDIVTGGVVVYTTDHEPRHPQVPYRNLLRLAQYADLWITDCQYSDHVYTAAKGGLQRFNWGHSYPEAIAHTAAQAKVKRVALFHHDPASSDDDIAAIADSVRDHLDRLGHGDIAVVPAHEGLVLEV